MFPSIWKIIFSFLDAGFKPGDTWSALLLEEEWAEPESKVGLKRKYLWFHFSPSALGLKVHKNENFFGFDF